MNKFSLFFILMMGGFLTAFSQGRLLTIDEATIGQYRQFAPQMFYQLNWIPGSDSYSYFRKKSEMLMCSVKSGKESIMFTTQELNNLLLSKELKPVAAFPFYDWILIGYYSNADS